MSKQASVKGKFKSIFGRKVNNINAAHEETQGNEFTLTREEFKDISKENTVIHRAKALKELSDVVEKKALAEHSIEALLVAIQDLLDPIVPTDGRHAALHFLIALAKGQYKYLQIVRSQFFRIIVTHSCEDDLHLRITLLSVLTDSGKDVSYCEQIGAFLIHFMSDALFSTNWDEFLKLLVNMVHYNSSFLDKEIICSLVQKTCDFCTNANGEHEIESCLLLLDATVRYGGLPTEGLYPLITTLCQTVNIQKFCQPSWKLMRNLVGTKIGHTAIFIMCQILEDNNNVLKIILLRGAIFFIGMSIWGSKRVPSLCFSPLHVLPSFKIALQSHNTLVAHEISLSLQRLVKKFGMEQEILTWDLILDIIDKLLKLFENFSVTENESLHNIVHSILSNIEQLYRENKFYGSAERFFGIIGSCAHDRPEFSVIHLLTYYQVQINPANYNWLELFNYVFERYFKKEKRTSIRIKVVNMTASVLSLYKYKYEDELLTLALNGNISNAIRIEQDHEVLVVISQLLSDILNMCSPEKYPEVLAVMESMLSSISQKGHGENLQDIEITIDALIKVFREKLFEPYNNYVVNIFTILVNHIHQHYNNSLATPSSGVIRKRIFDLLLSVRANQDHFIGITDHEGNIKYSVHAIFKPTLEDLAGFEKVWLVDSDFQCAFDAILKCLKNDLDWIVLAYVLKNLAQQLENKNLYVYCQCNMSKLCSALCMMVSDKMYLHKVMNCLPNMGISELRNMIFPILSVIATYHGSLTKERQFDLVHCLEFGLNTYCAHTCVSCLTICTLEMQSVMVRLLPQIMVKLSQISATVVMSIPVLEFLSTLKEIPKLYANFVEEQYMSIFAMALSYTDPHKYSLYIVTLAHQVIADWFTRCRLTFRKGFVTLIAKALKSGLENADELFQSVDSKCADARAEIKVFHQDMFDVCLDMMARYSFYHHLSEPKRSPIVDFLLSNGVSETWLVGNMLVTVTTSTDTSGKCVCSQFQVRMSDAMDNAEEVDMFYDEVNNDSPQIDNDVVSLETEHVKSTDTNSTLVDYTEVGNEVPSDIFSDVNTQNPGLLYEIDTQPDRFITESSEVVDAGERSIEEEGCEPTPLVVKLTQQLVDPNSIGKTRVFSPSEQLLFSRQASKVPKSEHAENYEDDDDEEEEEDEDEGSESSEEYFDENIHQCERSRPTEAITIHQCVTNNVERSGVPTNLTRAEVEEPVVISKPHISEVELKRAKPDCRKDEHKCILPCHCRCSLNGWAEVYIRRPTGNISWVMKLENKDNVLTAPLSEITMMALSLEGHNVAKKLSSASSISSLHKRRNSTGSMETVAKSLVSEEFLYIDSEVGGNNVHHTELSMSPARKVPLIKSLSSPQSSFTNNQRIHFMHINNSQDHKPTLESISREKISPSFVFLQLFYSGCLDTIAPVLLEHSEVNTRATRILDRIPSFNTHKFGVLYVGYDQEQSEVDILSNEFGSTRYTDFISGLGDLVKLTECSATASFTGGMDRDGADGKFAYIWKDDTTQVVFHIATMMPTKASDSHYVSKKLHIGNNFVTIIYDDSKHGYKFGTIKGQFNLAEIHIRPVEYNSNVVTIRKKTEIGNEVTGPYVISDNNLAILIRQLAIHTNMAAVTESQCEKGTTNAYASNWLERLRQIKRIKTKVTPAETNYHVLVGDFTMYT